MCVCVCVCVCVCACVCSTTFSCHDLNTAVGLPVLNGTAVVNAMYTI